MTTTYYDGEYMSNNSVQAICDWNFSLRHATMQVHGQSRASTTVRSKDPSKGSMSAMEAYFEDVGWARIRSVWAGAVGAAATTTSAASSTETPSFYRGLEKKVQAIMENRGRVLLQ